MRDDKRLFCAALYMRLSKDDDAGAEYVGENIRESASIAAQRKLLRAYAEENGFDVFGEYIEVCVII